MTLWNILSLVTRHPDVGLEEIGQTLLDPDEVRMSKHNNVAKIYYAIKRTDGPEVRYTQVVVKYMVDGNFISTATTASKLKSGEVVYKRSSDENNV